MLAEQSTFDNNESQLKRKCKGWSGLNDVNVWFAVSADKCVLLVHSEVIKRPRRDSRMVGSDIEGIVYSRYLLHRVLGSYLILQYHVVSKLKHQILIFVHTDLLWIKICNLSLP